MLTVVLFYRRKSRKGLEIPRENIAQRWIAWGISLRFTRKFVFEIMKFSNLSIFWKKKYPGFYLFEILLTLTINLNCQRGRQWKSRKSETFASFFLFYWLPHRDFIEFNQLTVKRGNFFIRMNFFSRIPSRITQAFHEHKLLRFFPLINLLLLSSVDE